MIELDRIYCESCMDTMSRMPDKSVDLTLTDPPYGIGLGYDSYVDTDENWKNLMAAAVPEMRRVSKMVITHCGKIARFGWIYERFPPDWLICWYKGSKGHRAYIGFNDYELHLVYGKTHSRLCMHDYFQTKGATPKGKYGHPCPKPDGWAEWLISRATKPGQIVYDPFMGSGTTAKMALLGGRRFIGSEISPAYCRIAEGRVAEAANTLLLSKIDADLTAAAPDFPRVVIP